MAVDEDTSESKFLLWARILVKAKGWNFPSSLQVVVVSTSYAIQMWWETPPWKSEVHPLQRSRGRGGGIQGMDRSRAPQRVAKVLSMKGASLVSLDDPLISEKGKKAPSLMRWEQLLVQRPVCPLQVTGWSLVEVGLLCWARLCWAQRKMLNLKVLLYLKPN